jgi:uncharacterized membrane protein (UPF0182 family)
VYLKAEGTNFPQLKRVIAVTADRVVMEPTLDGALADLFGAQTQQTAEGTTASIAQSPPQPQPQPQLAEARTQLEAAQKAMQQGNWEDFGKAMQSLLTCRSSLRQASTHSMSEVRVSHLFREFSFTRETQFSTNDFSLASA